MEASQQPQDPASQDARFATYEFAQVRRIALYLRSAATELEQMHPETDTPEERHRCVAGCLHKMREAEELLSRMAGSLRPSR